jgi:type II secretory ATPase GspE/PulE/Tfp pilus assembly ATPase PilB-like protein
MTTLHTDDATSALMRLVDVTGESMIVGDATKLVISQRLVRRLCPKCAEDASPDPALLAQIKEQARSGGFLEMTSNRFRKPAGCKDCGFTGYRGRQVMAEVLEVTPQVASAIKSKHDARDIKRLAVSQGMTSMLAHGLIIASEGTTSLEEVLRVAPKD